MVNVIRTSSLVGEEFVIKGVFENILLMRSMDNDRLDCFVASVHTNTVIQSIGAACDRTAFTCTPAVDA